MYFLGAHQSGGRNREYTNHAVKAHAASFRMLCICKKKKKPQPIAKFFCIFASNGRTVDGDVFLRVSTYCEHVMLSWTVCSEDALVRMCVPAWGERSPR